MGLKYTDGFKRPVPSLLVGLAIVGSLVLLSVAARSIPIGTAYAIWVGIGALGAATLGVIYFGEPLNPARVVCLVCLLGAIIGLKLTSGSPSSGLGP